MKILSEGVSKSLLMFMDSEMEQIALFGVPTTNQTAEETVDDILSLIERGDKQSALVTTVNLHSLAATYGWWGSQPCNPELLSILRRAAVVIAEGIPLICLSHLLGSPLKGRIKGFDLVSLLVEKLAENKKKLFLLGGERGVAKAAAEVLERRYPGVQIVGTASSWICTEGVHLFAAEERDTLLIEQINQAKPDLLLIALGHPKQEIWFNRVQSELKVPITVGVGEVLNVLSGKQKQESRRLFSRYLLNSAKMGLRTLPLLLYHATNRLVSSFYARPKRRGAHLFLSLAQSLALIQLPRQLKNPQLPWLKRQIEAALSQDVVVFDCRSLLHADPAALALLIEAWLRFEQLGKQIFCLSVRGDLRLLLTLHGSWDLFESRVCNSLSALIERLHSGAETPFYESISQKGNSVTLSFLGQLDYQRDYSAYLQKLSPMLLQKQCVVDLTYCSLIDSRGFSFLLQLRHLIISSGCTLKLAGVSQSIKRQFHLAGVWNLFEKN